VSNSDQIIEQFSRQQIAKRSSAVNGSTLDRRIFLTQALEVLAIPSALSVLIETTAEASPINSDETFVLPPDKIHFQPWGNLPASSGEMAKLYGDFDEPGPYLVVMKWNPGWFSAPHNYRTDRIQIVISGTWYVNSGPDFDPQKAVPVPAGGYVMRHARTWHYDGVPANIQAPAIIAVFGIGPVAVKLADPTQPTWRHI